MAGSMDVSDEDLWVFGYGSLMWRPGFSFEERRVARIEGYRRRLCVFSHVYRGTRERPGLVLGLDRGGECVGVAFRVAAMQKSSTISYLRERELVTDVYIETVVDAVLDNGKPVKAVTYIADPQHSQYAAPMEPTALVELVRQGRGISGPNVEYVLNTYRHLEALGIEDAELAFLAETVA